MTSASLTCLALSYTLLISGDDDDHHVDVDVDLETGTTKRRICMTMMTMLNADADFDSVCHIILFDPKLETKSEKINFQDKCKKVQKGKMSLMKSG